MWRAIKGSQLKFLSYSQRRMLPSSRHALRANYSIKRPNPPATVHFKMEAVEITRRQIPIFEKCSVLYVNCIDFAAEFNEAPRDLPFLSYKMLLGHVKFPDELQNRRMALFPNTTKTTSDFRNLKSPVVIDVTNSSIVKVICPVRIRTTL